MEWPTPFFLVSLESVCCSHCLMNCIPNIYFEVIELLCACVSMQVVCRPRKAAAFLTVGEVFSRV